MRGSSIITASSILEMVCNFSYSTSIRFIASNATSSSIAATAATGSPIKRTLSRQRVCSSWLTGRIPYGIGRSFPVIIAKTPGNAAAFEVSMLLISACGSCVLNILQKSIRGNTISSANFVCPVHFERASTFRKGLPMTVSGCPFLLLPFLLMTIHKDETKMNADSRGQWQKKKNKPKQASYFFDF